MEMKGDGRKVATKPESVLVLTLWPGYTCQARHAQCVAASGESQRVTVTELKELNGISTDRLFSVASVLCPISRGDLRGCGL